MRKTVLMDVDGCLSEFTLAFRKMAHQLCGATVHDTMQQQTWEYTDIPPETLKKLWEEVRCSCHFWARLDPLAKPHEFNLLDRMGRGPWLIYYVTNRPGMTAIEQTRYWLERQSIRNPNVIVVPSAKSKGLIASALGARYILEDHILNARAVADATLGYTKPYLIDRPYNQADSEFARVNSVTEFIERVEAQS